MSQRRTPFSSDQRRRANDDQIRVFFQEYEPTWRLTKLLTIKLNLEERSKLQTYLEGYYNNGLPTDDYVYRVASNGLVFSALAETFMAIEDFFALFRFIREEEYFVQKIVTYSAGTIKNVINKVGGLSVESSLKALLVPSADFVSEAMARAASTNEDSQEERFEFLEQYKIACTNTIQSLQKVTGFFKEYETFYNQYKHGLTVALRPFAVEASQAYLEQCKTSLGSDLFVFDNDTIEVAFNTGNLASGALVLPAFTESTRPYLYDLQKERNLLRYFPLPAKLDIDDLIEVVRSVAVLSLCLIGNRLDFIDRNREDYYTFSVVQSVENKPLARLNVSVECRVQPIALNHFKIDI